MKTLPTKQYENAKGVYFLTDHIITEVYHVAEQRYLGTTERIYWLATKSSLKKNFNSLGAAIKEAQKRQAWIDQQNTPA